MKLNNLINARRVIAKHKNDKLPSLLAYKFMKFLKASDESEAFYNERANAIIDEFALKEENGEKKIINGRIAIQPAKVEECNRSFEELNNVDVDDINIKFSIKELECMQLTIAEMVTLEDIITD